MNHKWNKQKTKCTRCGLERITQTLWRFGLRNLSFTYFRSGNHWSRDPGCIDWDKENSKTID